MLTGVALHQTEQALPEYFSAHQALPEDSELSCLLPPVLLLHFHTRVQLLQQDEWRPTPADGVSPLPDAVLPAQVSERPLPTHTPVSDHCQQGSG